MMIESNYEINVAKKGKRAFDDVERYYHYCRIELGFMMPDDAKEKLHELRELFPKEFKLTLSYVDCRSKQIEEV